MGGSLFSSFFETEERAGESEGRVLQKILPPFCHESLLVPNDTILIPLNH